MEIFPVISPWAVALAALLAFAWGGVYFATVAPRVSRPLRLDPGPAVTAPAVTAPAAMVGAVVTRAVLAYGIALVLAFADVEHPLAGALGGIAVFTVILLPVQVGQAAFGGIAHPWRRLAVPAPESIVGMSVMGAIGVLWR